MGHPPLAYHISFYESLGVNICVAPVLVVRLVRLKLPDSTFLLLSPSIATALTRTVGPCAIGVKPKTDAAAMPRTDTRTSFSRPTTTSPPVDEQSVRAKSPSLDKDSEVSQNLAKLTSTSTNPFPLPSTCTTTATLYTTGSPNDYAIEDDSEGLREFEDNGDTHAPKLEAFPRIKTTCARRISLIGKLIRSNTPPDNGSGDGAEKTRLGQPSGNTEQGSRISPSQVEDVARRAKEGLPKP